ncbi:MAG: hypothetical protein AB1486_16135 [Planctomycetota bacterium]
MLRFLLSIEPGLLENEARDALLECHSPLGNLSLETATRATHVRA